ncbi:MAG: S-adenosylmethionine:tRNA ribosyltransferase-isomerase [Hymenobacter sp.]
MYAAHEGAVAAPTAGLHFTPELLAELTARGIGTGQLTLHVGAGTFQPVKAETMADHPMHAEPIIVSAELLRQLLAHRPRPVIAVGTTSLRTLESLYWLGAALVRGATPAALEVSQWQPYAALPPARPRCRLRRLCRRCWLTWRPPARPRWRRARGCSSRPATASGWCRG